MVEKSYNAKFKAFRFNNFQSSFSTADDLPTQKQFVAILDVFMVRISVCMPHFFNTRIFADLDVTESDWVSAKLDCL